MLSAKCASVKDTHGVRWDSRDLNGCEKRVIDLFHSCLYRDLGDLAKQLSANNDVYSRSSRICVFFLNESDECFAGHEFAETIIGFWMLAGGRMCIGCQELFNDCLSLAQTGDTW